MKTLKTCFISIEGKINPILDEKNKRFIMRANPDRGLAIELTPGKFVKVSLGVKLIKKVDVGGIHFYTTEKNKYWDVRDGKVKIDEEGLLYIDVKGIISGIGRGDEVGYLYFKDLENILNLQGTYDRDFIISELKKVVKRLKTIGYKTSTISELLGLKSHLVLVNLLKDKVKTSTAVIKDYVDILKLETKGENNVKEN